MAQQVLLELSKEVVFYGSIRKCSLNFPKKRSSMVLSGSAPWTFQRSGLLWFYQEVLLENFPKNRSSMVPSGSAPWGLSNEAVFYGSIRKCSLNFPKKRSSMVPSGSAPWELSKEAVFYDSIRKCSLSFPKKRSSMVPSGSAPWELPKKQTCTEYRTWVAPVKGKSANHKTKQNGILVGLVGLAMSYILE
jgi:hypothetical protein